VRAKFEDNIEVLAYRVRQLTHAVTPTLDIEDGVDVNQKYGVQVFNDLQEALAKKPDVTFITNPSSLHIPVALEVARARSHLFVEKPLSHNLEGVDELISICTSNNLVGYVAYQLRYHPAAELVKALLEKNALGSILSVHAEVGEYLPDWHKYEDYRQMYASCKDLGGGVILSQIHEFDYLYNWFGLPQRIVCIGGHLSSLEINTEDTVKILLEVSFQGKPLPISLHMDFNQRPPSRGCKIIGENGKLELNFVTSAVTITYNDGRTEVQDFSHIEHNNMFIKELDHFFNCVEERAQPLVSLADGASSLRMALAAKESLETGRIVTLEDPINSCVT